MKKTLIQLTLGLVSIASLSFAACGSKETVDKTQKDYSKYNYADVAKMLTNVSDTAELTLKRVQELRKK